jgi:hypothetical protein
VPQPFARQKEFSALISQSKFGRQQYSTIRQRRAAVYKMSRRNELYATAR